MAEADGKFDLSEEALDALKRSRAVLCYECGKCSGVCPVARYDSSFSPRSVLVKAVRGEGDVLVHDVSVWSCLTCKLCDTRCPAAIDYGLLTKTVRTFVRHEGGEGVCTHGGAVQALMRIMTSDKLEQDRLSWVDDSVEISKKGDTIYFVGCAPYFDTVFSETEARTIDSAKGAIRLLNAAGVKPGLLPNERCCGHDLLWHGDNENFRMLAEQNVAMLRESGAKRVIFGCPEGYATFKVDYPPIVGDLGFEVVHLSELVRDAIDAGELKFNSGGEMTVTFQDPCRLGRHMGIYDAPRQILSAMPGVTLVEMPKSRERGICCGVSGWTNCTSFSKAMQARRLREARSTGADTLVTACPKCEIHLKCALNDEVLRDEVRLEVKDLWALAASRLA
jgi:Fe-S oxidoreductase